MQVILSQPLVKFQLFNKGLNFLKSQHFLSEIVAGESGDGIEMLK